MAGSDEEIVARFETNYAQQMLGMSWAAKLLTQKRKWPFHWQVAGFLFWIFFGVIVYWIILHFRTAVLFDGTPLDVGLAWLFVFLPSFFVIGILYFVSLVRKWEYGQNIKSLVPARDVILKTNSTGLTFESTQQSIFWNYSTIDQVAKLNGGLIIRFGLYCYFIPSQAFINTPIKTAFLNTLKLKMRVDALKLSDVDVLGQTV